MPTKGNPRHAFRFEPGLWEAFTEAVKQDPLGRDPTTVIRHFVTWYARIGRVRKLVRPDPPPRRDS
jgi:hypothetical protein